MSGSRVYEFHQREIDDLKTAAVYTLGVCTDLKRLLEGIRDNQPHWASRAIREFLDPENRRQSYLDKVDHLIDPVGVPVKVPRRAKVNRGTGGIHYERFPLTCEMRDEALAHRAAWVVHDTFRTYLWSVWCRGNPTYIYSDDVGAAADELVESRWQEIRDELEAFVDFDCDGLRQAVEAESKAAMERCRQSIVSETERQDKTKRGADTETGNGGNQADDKAQKMKTVELPPPAETVDALGYVTNPKDPTAYIAAFEILRNHTPAALATTYKQFSAILKKHREIRRWQVRTNRLSVHLADWTKYVQGETGKVDDDGLLADEFEIEARKAEIRRRKTPGK